MIVLDTNVISELMRPAPNADVVAWVDGLPAGELAVTAVTVAEVLYGIARLEDGQRKGMLGALARTMFEEEFGGRVLAFGAEEAEVYAELVARRHAQGSPISMADSQIAAVAVCRGARLGTRNVGDFAGLPLEVVNPWGEGG
ncbi:MAG: type II toxin-antitoxin system VapC family toxin [Thiohalorhabdus sp.]|uniref:type II toxin-antitoxin system VapC family toxin n=1 Tax=Thiohalorhabdus sp. TaxID=3094134 RepID=UPI0039818EF8